MNFVMSNPFESIKGNLVLFDLHKVTSIGYREEHVYLSFRERVLLRSRPYVRIVFDNGGVSLFYFDSDNELLAFLQKIDTAIKKEHDVTPERRLPDAMDDDEFDVPLT